MRVGGPRDRNVHHHILTPVLERSWTEDSYDMRKIITQTINLPAPADILYKVYMNAEMHAAVTGGAAEVHPEPGGKFQAFDGTLSGKFLHIVKSRLVVQSWRSSSFHEDDPDTTLILNFSSDGNKGRIELVHLDVPSHNYSSIKNGWNTYYWQPLLKYLAG